MTSATSMRTARPPRSATWPSTGAVRDNAGHATACSHHPKAIRVRVRIMVRVRVRVRVGTQINFSFRARVRIRIRVIIKRLLQGDMPRLRVLPCVHMPSRLKTYRAIRQQGKIEGVGCVHMPSCSTLSYRALHQQLMTRELSAGVPWQGHPGRHPGPAAAHKLNEGHDRAPARRCGRSRGSRGRTGDPNRRVLRTRIAPTMRAAGSTPLGRDHILCACGHCCVGWAGCRV